MKTILAGIDFSPVSRRVIELAVRLASAPGRRLVLFHTVIPRAMGRSTVTRKVNPRPPTEAGAQRDAARRLAKWQRSLKTRGLGPVEIICTRGLPVPEIIHQATRLDAEFIVVGRHRHTAFFEYVIGGTCCGLLKHATCPVVVVTSHHAPAASKALRSPASKARVRTVKTTPLFKLSKL